METTIEQKMEERGHQSDPWWQIEKFQIKGYSIL